MIGGVGLAGAAIGSATAPPQLPTPPCGAATITITAQDNPWRYTGGYQDPTDGYYHLGARYYDTQIHFTQADPVAGLLNRPEKYKQLHLHRG